MKKKNCFLSGFNIKWWDSPEFKKVLILVLKQKRGILRLLSAPVRYAKRKIESAYKRLVKKGQKKKQKMKYIIKSVDKLKEIAKLKII